MEPIPVSTASNFQSLACGGAPSARATDEFKTRALMDLGWAIIGPARPLLRLGMTSPASGC